MCFKINFKNKSVDSNRSNKTSKILGKMYFRYSIEESISVIHNGMLILSNGTQFNTHQQSSLPVKKGIRKSFGSKFKINYHKNIKRIIDLTTDQLEWWNTFWG